MNKNPYHLIGEPNASGAAPQKHGDGRSSGSQMTEHIVQLGEDRIKSSFAVYDKFHIGKSHWTLYPTKKHICREHGCTNKRRKVKMYNQLKKLYRAQLTSEYKIYLL